MDGLHLGYPFCGLYVGTLIASVGYPSVAMWVSQVAALLACSFLVGCSAGGGTGNADYFKHQLEARCN